MTRQKSDRWEEYHRAKGIMAQCVSLAMKDAGLSQQQRETLAEKYAAQAMKFLQEAIRHGFKDVEQLNRAADLGAIKARDDFKKMVRDAEARKKMGESR